MRHYFGGCDAKDGTALWAAGPRIDTEDSKQAADELHWANIDLGKEKRRSDEAPNHMHRYGNAYRLSFNKLDLFRAYLWCTAMRTGGFA